MYVASVISKSSTGRPYIGSTCSLTEASMELSGALVGRSALNLHPCSVWSGRQPGEELPRRRKEEQRHKGSGMSWNGVWGAGERAGQEVMHGKWAERGLQPSAVISREKL